ncbi:MAG: hypothetical protein PHS47_01505 [Methanocellales archaeon]|nr:hypothetical protein [Methanocellales archaeon]
MDHYGKCNYCFSICSTKHVDPEKHIDRQRLRELLPNRNGESDQEIGALVGDVYEI